MRKMTVIGIALLFFGIALGPAFASAPTSETFVLHRDQNLNETGWSATGTFSDGGAWRTDSAAKGGGPASPTFEIEIKTTEFGSDGNIQLQFQGHFNAVRSGDFTGTWQVVGGTGAYTTLHGRGTWRSADDPDTGGITFTCIGQVHFDS
jgi:hypothetical protein